MPYDKSFFVAPHSGEYTIECETEEGGRQGTFWLESGDYSKADLLMLMLQMNPICGGCGVWDKGDEHTDKVCETYARERRLRRKGYVPIVSKKKIFRLAAIQGLPSILGRVIDSPYGHRAKGKEKSRKALFVPKWVEVIDKICRTHNELKHAVKYCVENPDVIDTFDPLERMGGPMAVRDRIPFDELKKAAGQQSVRHPAVRSGRKVKSWER